MEELLQQSLSKNWQLVADAVGNLDVSGSGYLKQDELKKLIEKFAMPLSDDHFQK